MMSGTIQLKEPRRYPKVEKFFQEKSIVGFKYMRISRAKQDIKLIPGDSNEESKITERQNQLNINMHL